MNSPFSSSGNSIVDKATVYHDLNSLNNIRQESRRDEKQALKSAVKEFEAYFLNLMLKNMRSANQVIGEDSPLNSNDVQFYNEMHDQQLAVELSQTSRFGIADVLFKQLSGHLSEPVNSSKNTLKNKSAASNNDLLSTKVNNRNDLVRNPSLVTRSNTEKPLESESMHHINSDSRLSSEEMAPLMLVNRPDAQTFIGNPLVSGASFLLKSSQSTLSTSASSRQDRATQIDDASIKTPTIESKPVESKAFNSKQDFIEHLKPLAVKAAKLLGVAPGILIAQAALETGWGKFFTKDASGSESFNLFGIKANQGWQGKQVSSNTLEFEQGIPKKMRQNFRAYDTLEDSVLDYVSFIKENPRYQSALENRADPKAYIEQIQAGGYATDPDYATKVLSIFQRESLNAISSE